MKAVDGGHDKFANHARSLLRVGGPKAFIYGSYVRYMFFHGVSGCEPGDLDVMAPGKSYKRLVVVLDRDYTLLKYRSDGYRRYLSKEAPFVYISLMRENYDDSDGFGDNAPSNIHNLIFYCGGFMSVDKQGYDVIDLITHIRKGVYVPYNTLDCNPKKMKAMAKLLKAGFTHRESKSSGIQNPIQ